MNKKVIHSIVLGLVTLMVGSINGISDVYANSNWIGHAVYRDGVVGNLNDHAALMDASTMNASSVPIIHAPGYDRTSRMDTRANFLDGNSYVGVYKPKNRDMTRGFTDMVKATAREMTGIPYTSVHQIKYNAGSYNHVVPESVTYIRCDGLVEYAYEWNFAKVGGEGAYWDICENDTRNLREHQGIKINPRRQREYLLDKVSSSEPK